MHELLGEEPDHTHYDGDFEEPAQWDDSDGHEVERPLCEVLNCVDTHGRHKAALVEDRRRSLRNEAGAFTLVML